MTRNQNLYSFLNRYDAQRFGTSKSHNVVYITLQVTRLIYTNSGLAILSLAANAVHKLWKWQKSDSNSTGKVIFINFINHNLDIGAYDYLALIGNC